MRRGADFCPSLASEFTPGPMPAATVASLVIAAAVEAPATPDRVAVPSVNRLPQPGNANSAPIRAIPPSSRHRPPHPAEYDRADWSRLGCRPPRRDHGGRHGLHRFLVLVHRRGA